MVVVEEFFADNIGHLKQILKRINQIIDQNTNTLSIALIGDAGQMLPIKGSSIFKKQSFQHNDE